MITAVMFALCGTCNVFAGTKKDYTGGSAGTNTTLRTAGNWEGGTLPGSTDDARLNSTATSLTITNGVLTVESMNVDNGRSYTISNTGATSDSTLNIGNSSSFTNAWSTVPDDLIYLTGSSSLTIGNGPSRLLSVVLQSSGNFNVGSTSTLSINSAISGTAKSITKTGGGIWTLAGANTYSGGTAVDAGTLRVNNTTGSGTGSGGVTVTGTGTILGGSGFINAGSNNVTIGSGARMEPGSASATIGTLTLTATTLFMNGTYAVDLNSTTNDRLTLVGTLNLGTGTDILSFNQLAAPSASSYTLATYSSLVGTFDTVSGLPDGYRLNYGATELTLVPVPEPSTYAAGFLAFAAIGLTQRQRIGTLLSRKAVGSIS